MNRHLFGYRRPLVVSMHIVLIVLANYLAFWLRFDGAIPKEQIDLMHKTLLWLVVIRGITFLPFRLYEGLWRYIGIWDLRDIVLGVGCSTVLFYSITHFALGFSGYPRSVFIIDSLLLIFLMGGIRLLRRFYGGLSRWGSGSRVLIYGASDTGEVVVRDIKNNVGKYNCRVVGFLDDDRAKVGQRIHGVPVLGTRSEISNIMSKTKPDEVLIAMPSVSSSTIRTLVTLLEPFKVSIKTLGNLTEQLNGGVFKQFRDVCVDDLLDRASVGLESQSLEKLIQGKRILVTGAGGSIGSELARQIAAKQPDMLVLMDKAESALYEIDMEVGSKFPEVKREAVLADVKHINVLEGCFRQHSIQVVFHAAAYKHVPMMENYPKEAVLNNVIGTYRLAQVAMQFNAERFVLISTDKAVNPTNVMGATKRLGELYVQALAQNRGRSQTIFSAVRFGNVLGSNGSVIPLFLQQIDRGGPLTVTHPEVRRYFMTIAEAVQLVLRAATLGKGGEIFVLEMGEQIKILDMARRLIRICGFVPEKEIPIDFVGLRPGEKLEEELSGMDETLVASGIENIRVVRCGWIPKISNLTRRIAELETLAIQGKTNEIIDVLYGAIPTFRPSLEESSFERSSAGAVNAEPVIKQG